MHISLKPDTIFTLGSNEITNSIFTAFFVFFIILIFLLIIRVKLKYSNPGRFQLVIEMLVNGLYGLASNSLDDKKLRKLFSFLLTFFVFILTSNLLGLTPMVQSFVIKKEEVHEEEISTEVSANEKTEEHEEETDSQEYSFGKCLTDKDCVLSINGIEKDTHAVHLFRPPTSDLSMGLALALVSVLVTNILGFKYAGIGFLKKYINFSNPINFLVGILEIVSEVGKLISFSFRLFGNIFAGEVLLTVITGISFGIATLPFMFLEIFVGFIQAFVFFILTAVFIGLASAGHEH